MPSRSGRGRAEHHGRVPGGGRVQPGAVGQLGADRAGQVEVGGRAPRCRRSPPPGCGRCGTPGRRRPCRSRRPAAPGRSGRSSPPTRRAAWRRSPNMVSARADGQQVGAERGRVAVAGRPGWTRRCRPPRSSRRCRSRCPARTGTPAAAGRAARSPPTRTRSAARSRAGRRGASLRSPARRASAPAAAALAAISRSWVITTTVVPAACSSRSRSSTPAPEAESRLPVGSSASSSGRLADHRAGDRDPLPLAAGELVRPVPEPVAEPDPVQRGLGAPPALLLRHAGVEQPVGHVVHRVTPGGQVELLEDEADPAGPQRGQLPVGERRDVVPVDPDAARGRPVQRADQVQHGGLAGAGRADDRDQLAVADPQADVVAARSPRPGTPC